MLKAVLAHVPWFGLWYSTALSTCFVTWDRCQLLGNWRTCSSGINVWHVEALSFDMVKWKLVYDVEIIHVSWKIFCGFETVLVTLHQHAAFTMKIWQNTKNAERLLRMWSAWISSGLDSLAAWLSMLDKFQSADEEATELFQPLVSPEFPSENEPNFGLHKYEIAICLLVAVLCKREILLQFPYSV